MTNITTTNSQVPAFMQGAAAYKEDVNVKEISIPRINAAQLVSEVTKKGTVKYGEIYSTVGDNFGKEFDFIVIKPFVNYVIFQDGKIAGRSDDGVTWKEGTLAGTKVDQAEAFKYKRYNYYVLKTDAKEPIPYILSLYSSSGSKAGKQLYNLIGISTLKDKVPCFAKAYKLKTREDKNNLGSYTAFDIESTPGFVSEQLFKMAAEARAFIENNLDTIKHHDDVHVVEATSNVTAASDF